MTDNQTETRNFTLPIENIKETTFDFSHEISSPNDENRKAIHNEAFTNLEFRSKINESEKTKNSLISQISAENATISKLDKEIENERSYICRLEKALFVEPTSSQYGLQQIVQELPLEKRDLIKLVDSTLLSQIIHLEQENDLLTLELNKSEKEIQKIQNDLEKDKAHKQKLINKEKEIQRNKAQTQNKIKSRQNVHVSY